MIELPPHSPLEWALSVRDAHPGDLATVIDFNVRLALETEGKSLDRKILSRGVTRALAEPERLRYWIAETHVGDGAAPVIVGQAAITREWSDWRNGWVWWFQSVYVHHDYRRHGVFRALHQQIRSLALAAPDVIGLRLYVESANDRAQETYQALGFTPVGYHVYEDLWPERFHRS